MLKYSMKAGLDKFLWERNPLGLFTTRSAWDLVRGKGAILEVSKWIWHHQIPKKISICMWKAYYRYFPCDDNIKTIDVRIISACN